MYPAHDEGYERFCDAIEWPHSYEPPDELQEPPPDDSDAPPDCWLCERSIPDPESNSAGLCAYCWIGYP